MRCANPAFSAGTLYLRSSGIFAVGFLGETENAGESQSTQRRVIWLCDACTGLFSVETWRPPGKQARHSGSSLARLPRGKRGAARPREAGI